MIIAESERHSLLRGLLSSSLPVLCKNGLGIPDVQFSVEAFVGITVGNGEEVILVSIKETITSEGNNISHVWSSPDKDVVLIDDDGSRPIKAENEDQVQDTGDKFNDSSVCDLTNEDESEVVIKEEISTGDHLWENFTYPRSDHFQNFPAHSSNYSPNQGSQNSLVRMESMKFRNQSQRAGGFVKPEPNSWNRGNQSSISQIQQDVEQIIDDDEDGCLDNMLPIKTEDYDLDGHGSAVALQERQHQQRFSHGRSPGYPRARSGRSGRSRSLRRGRQRRYETVSSSSQQCISEDSNPMTNGRTSCSGDGAYQDIMKEMCQQVVSQSMSVETQYVCHICQARRSSKSSLMDHIRGTHLAMDKYTCKECGQRFRWFMQLHRHRKKFHPEPGYEGGDDQMAMMMGDGEYDDNDDGGGFIGDVAG